MLFPESPPSSVLPGQWGGSGRGGFELGDFSSPSLPLGSLLAERPRAGPPWQTSLPQPNKGSVIPAPPGRLSLSQLQLI